MTIAECLRQLSAAGQLPATDYQLLPPASPAALEQLEQAAGVALPTELRELYQLSNGIGEFLRQEVGAEPLPVGFLLLPAEEAAAENRRIQQQLQTPTKAALLVVAHAYVDGIQIGYWRQDLPAASAAIYAWLPIDDELVRLADSLPAFLLDWASGQSSI